MKVAGLWAGHDCSFCVLDSGKPLIHAEFERYNREKSPPGDSAQFMFDRYQGTEEISHFASVYPRNKLTQYEESYKKIDDIAQKNGGKIIFKTTNQSKGDLPFKAAILKNEEILGEGLGASKKAAEQAASKQVLNEL